MVKAYLRYEHARAFGVVASPEASPVYDASGKHLVTAALERLAVWDVRRGVEALSLVPPPRESGDLPAVTRIARASSGDLVAAGASDGSIRLWDLNNGSSDVLLKGHRGEVTALRFNASGTLLVSGGKDTNVVVWDVVAETGVCRLRGHKDQVTDAAFVEDGGGGVGGDAGEGGGGGGGGLVESGNGSRIVTCSKDGTVKVWDLDTQHCAQTVAALGAECWSLDVDARRGRLAVGTSDDRLHLFAVAARGDVRNENENENDSEDDAGNAEDEDDEHGDGGGGKRRKGVDGKSEMTRAERAASIADASNLLRALGHVTRGDKSRAATVRFDGGSGGLLGVQTAGRAVEVYRMRSDAEMAKRLKRKAKRKREKGKKDGGKGSDAANNEDGDGEGVVAADELELVTVVRTKAKTRGFAFAPAVRRRPGIRAVVAVLLDNNTVEEWELASPEANEPSPEPSKTRSLEAAGHRADIRAVALSPDDATLVTCSHKGVKVWNPTEGACLRTIEGGYGLCTVFAPGGRHVVVGTKAGALEILDVQAGTQLTGAPEAHAGAVWGLALLPDGSGFLSASADKSVKFWEWRLIDVEEEEGGMGEEGTGAGGGGTRRELGVAHVKTLQMAEDVLSIRVTPDGKLLSVSLLDNTLKVFFADSLKFFLSLYGHRLPALCHDVSSDSQLLASGGADKNIRIWGLDFGDCHRSIFAHDDSVTALAFVPKTHYLFSTGKDKCVKYWDADKFEPLLTLNGHHAAAWCVAVSSRGDFCVSGGHDRAIRVWERTDEPFFVDEERERRLESLLDEGGIGDDDDDDRVAQAARDAAAANGGVAPAGAEAGMAGRKTLETLSAADAIVDALDVARHERERIDAHIRQKSKVDGDAKPTADANGDSKGDAASSALPFTGGDDDISEYSDDDDAVDAVVVSGSVLGGPSKVYPPGLMPNPLLMGETPERYALSAIEKVKAADLEQAILSLPFSSAIALLEYLGGWLEAGERVELTCRLAALIVRLHYVQLGATASARGVLLKLRPLIRRRAAELRDLMGFNIAGLGMLEGYIADGGGGTTGHDDDDDEDDDGKLIMDDVDDAPALPGWG